MIGVLLGFVANELNKIICKKLSLPVSDKKVLLSPIVKPDGSIAVKQKNVLIVDLVNIKKDPLINNNFPPLNKKGTEYLNTFPPLYLNLDVLIVAYFESEQFKSGLDVLSMLMAIFQGKPLWNRKNTPNLPEGLDKIVFEIASLDFHEQSHLWGYIGAKYMPSVVYKVRMAVIDDKNVLGEIPPITDIIIEADNEEIERKE